MAAQANNSIFLIPLLPLLGALFNLFLGRVIWRIAFGRDPSRTLVHVVAVASVAAACGVALWLVAGPLWQAYQVWHEGGAAASSTLMGGLHQKLYTWIEVGPLAIDLAFRIDTLSAVMILVVTFVGTLIHIFSTGYMADEPRYAAYFGYLNLFTGAMLILVLGDNLPVMFIGWEGVGLCSYLLIGFWFTNESYANAGRKAFVVNRIGDFAFLLGMFLLYQAVGGLDFDTLRSDGAMATYTTSFWGGERLAMWAGFFLFIGACGKSAQIPLYVWLPDAMAGPTPVSALIHAATMVTAGVYMVARLSFLYVSSTTAMAIVAGVGALTALVAAAMAFAQTDFKKVLAYSTVSQLGFMFVAVGVGAYAAGVFHLITHAFFKAGLFLAAGSVMHAMSGSGDITKMGGLARKLPHTHKAFVVYWLAICGIFPLAGFFSKDEILAGAWAADAAGWAPLYGKLLWGVLTLAALGTAFYMSRLYFLVFRGECRADEETKRHIHESPVSMTGPLWVLAAGTVVLGAIGLPHLSFLGKAQNLLGHWLDAAVATPAYAARYKAVGESLGMGAHLGTGELLGLMGFALLIGLAGIGMAYQLYGKGPSTLVARKTAGGFGATLHRVVYNKLYVDELYELIIVKPFRWTAQALFEFADRFVIDTIFVNGSAFVVEVLGRIARWLQDGRVHRYLAFVLVGAAAVFFFTREAPIDFSYQITADRIVLQADVGSGPAAIARGAVLRWDLDGNGKPDLKPGVVTATPQPDDYLSEPEPTVALRDVGPKVTLWYTDPVFHKTVEITRRIDKTAVSPAQGGGAQ